MTDINKLKSGNNIETFEMENNDMLGLQNIEPKQPEPKIIIQKEQAIHEQNPTSKPKQKKDIKNKKYTWFNKIQYTGLILIILFFINNNLVRSLFKNMNVFYNPEYGFTFITDLFLNIIMIIIIFCITMFWF